MTEDRTTNWTGAAVEASMPVDFSLRNQQDQHVLYTRLPDQALKLEVENTSREQLRLAPPDDPSPSAENYHLWLSFRPGTLWEAASVTLDGESGAAWSMGHEKRPDHSDAFYLLARKAIELGPGERLSLDLENVAVDGRGGSRGTRVELKYAFAAAGSPEPLVGTRLHYVSVLDEAPSAEPGSGPLTVDWVGSNTLLNDGQAHELRLRIKNTSGRRLAFDDSTQITLAFPIDDGSTPWALLHKQDIEGLEIENVQQFSGDGKTHQGDWSPKAESQEQARDQYLWTISEPPGDLEPGGYVDIPISLTSSAPNGTGDLRVRYEGFAHLADVVHVPVAKGPLVIRGRGVAVGTTEVGDHIFSVHGDTDLDGSLTVRGASALQGGLTVSGKTEAGAELVVSHPSAGAVVHVDGHDAAGQAYGLYLGADGDHPWLGSRTNHDLRIVTNQEERVRIAADGKVGIGTTSPGRYDFNVSAGIIKLGLEKGGGGQLIIGNNPNDNSIFLEAFNTTGDGTAAALHLTGSWDQKIPNLHLNADVTHVNGSLNPTGGALKVTGDVVADRFVGSLFIPDTRGTPPLPSHFYSNIAKVELKNSSDLLATYPDILKAATPINQTTWSTVLTLGAWTDHSVPVHQLCFNEKGVFWRQGRETTWMPWMTLVNQIE